MASQNHIAPASILILTAVCLSIPALVRAGDTAAAPGVVSHIKVLSDKVVDVSSLEAWKKSCIKDGMTDEQKALAIWNTVVSFQHQNPSPAEYLQQAVSVQDPVKMFNVYGYGICAEHSCAVEAMARYAGLEARGWAINGHSVPEVFWDGAWHLLDASEINYHRKPDEKIASVEEIVASVKDWLDKNPGYKGNETKLCSFMHGGGWKSGPALLAKCPFYDENGWNATGSQGWYSSMLAYDGTNNELGKPFVFEYGYSQGYQVNIQLRKGERLIRNWSNKGLQVGMLEGSSPDCLKGKVGEAAKYGDLAPGRIGNGTLEYDVPLASGLFRGGSLAVENLASKGEDNQAPALHLKDPAQPGTYIVRMPSSYVYLGGEVAFKAIVGAAGGIVVSLSDNNGLDWKQVAQVGSSGDQRLDLKAMVYRRYDYRLKFTIKGQGTGIDSLKIIHDIQHSQRPLPLLDKGPNTITFGAGTQEGTITIEGSTNPAVKAKQLVYTDFHPQTSNIRDPYLNLAAGTGEVTFPISTPGEMTRLSFGCHYRARDKADGWDMQVSFDGGKTFKTADRCAGPTAATCKYVSFTGVPACQKDALVRYSGQQRSATCMFDFRIDADYKEPRGGFLPVKVTYMWEENGQAKQDVHISKKPSETYTIECAVKPVMKSIMLELAE